MSGVEAALARMLAYREGHAVQVKDATTFGPDPDDVFAVTFVRIVAEDAVQAIAYGNPDEPPNVLVRWNPMSRESGDLAPFAEALRTYLERCIDTDQCPRLWLPHEPAARLLDLLGRRYRTNRAATVQLQQMGADLRALAEDYETPGQQSVAVAAALLATHFVTGQAPVKDAHLGALLAWFDDNSGLGSDDVVARADDIALVPASNVLTDAEDRRAERLRKDAKAAGGRGRDYDALVVLLRQAAEREWTLLVRARNTWTAAAIPSANSAQLASDSRDRITWNTQNGTPSRSRGVSLARLFHTYTDGADSVEAAALRADEHGRRSATETGHVLRGQVTDVVQPTRGRHPCHLQLTTTQPQVRVRPGSRVDLLGTNVTGTVTAVDGDVDRWRITIVVRTGVRTPPGNGTDTTWLPGAPPNLTHVRRNSEQVMRSSAHPLVTGAALPPDRPLPATGDLLAEARNMRTPR